MIYINKKNKNQILTFIPLIQDNYELWHIVSINFNSQHKEESEIIIKDFVRAYEDTEGFCYLESETKAISIMRLGKVENYSDIKSNVEKNLEGKKCKVVAQKMSSNGLKQIQINISDGMNKKDSDLLFKKREVRKKNVVLIADDDMFVRKTLNSFLSGVAETHEVETGSNVVSTYLKTNPDVVVLDIHMPGKSGLDIIKELSQIDSNSYIIISSSDSIKENILKAMDRGAVGFLAKPIQKEKLVEYVNQCITFSKEKMTEVKKL